MIDMKKKHDEFDLSCKKLDVESYEDRNNLTECNCFGSFGTFGTTGGCAGTLGTLGSC